jgi:hypothetical protein
LQVLGEGRSGVPQYRQPHVYLAETFVALKNLGIDMHAALLRAGGIQVNSLVDNFSVRAVQPNTVAPCGCRLFGGIHASTAAMPACSIVNAR